MLLTSHSIDGGILSGASQDLPQRHCVVRAIGPLYRGSGASRSHAPRSITTVFLIAPAISTATAANIERDIAKRQEAFSRTTDDILKDGIIVGEYFFNRSDHKLLQELGRDCASSTAISKGALRVSDQRPGQREPSASPEPVSSADSFLGTKGGGQKAIYALSQAAAKLVDVPIRGPNAENGESNRCDSSSPTSRDQRDLLRPEVSADPDPEAKFEK